MEETETKENQSSVKLESDVLNSIRHTFQTLDETNSGKVAKSKLQVLCASICRDIAVTFDTQHLVDFKSSSTTITFQDFIQYLQDHLLVKAQAETIDYSKVHKLCWTIVQQKFFKCSDHEYISEDSAFQQFLVFNILDIEEISKVEKEEIALILEKFVLAMGKSWDPKPLQEYCEENHLLTFWQYLECLEKYISGNEKCVVDEALEEIVDHIVNGIVKQGYLVKKGHKMKSMKERWFVLKPTNLTYFTNQTCSEQKGVITINKSSSVESVVAKGKYRFQVKCGESGTHYEMEAKDQKSRQEWIACIQASIDASDGPSPQTRERLQRQIDRNERKQKIMEDDRRKKEQEDLLLSQKEELARLQQLYQQAEAQAAEEAALLQEEIEKRKELERLQEELQQLLEAERRAKEEEEKARELQEQLLQAEKKRVEEMERLRLEKDQLLEDEMKMRENLEERHKEQEKLLEEERKRLEQIEKERLAAEKSMKEAQEKLAAAEEASKKAAEEAKKKAREIKTAVGLARPVGPQIPSWVTHRGIGAFCVSDFSKVGTNKSNGIQPEEDKAAGDQQVQESGKQSEVLPADLKEIDEETKTGMLQGIEDSGTASTI